MPFKIVRNDITRMQVDAIVNTANSQPIFGEGLDSAVYLAAGVYELLEERKKIGVLQEGDVAVTPGFQLPAKYIFHAVSPYYVEGSEETEEKLRSCYRKSLRLAYENQCESIAFPVIATGNCRYPKEVGIRIALDEIESFLSEHEMLVYLVVFDDASTELGMKLYPDLEWYIKCNYVDEEWKKTHEMFAKLKKQWEAQEEWNKQKEQGLFFRSEYMMHSRPGGGGGAPAQSSSKPSFSISAPKQSYSLPNYDISAPVQDVSKESTSKNELKGEVYDAFIEESQRALNERFAHMTDTFQEYLLYLIREKDMKNSDVYNRAIITKQLFSKIKQNPEYHPDKSTAMRLCVGAKLNVEETKELLGRAGYALSPCDKRDIVFSYFIERGLYDMIEIDIALEERGMECFIK